MDSGELLRLGRILDELEPPVEDRAIADGIDVEILEAIVNALD